MFWCLFWLQVLEICSSKPSLPSSELMPPGRTNLADWPRRSGSSTHTQFMTSILPSISLNWTTASFGFCRRNIGLLSTLVSGNNSFLNCHISTAKEKCQWSCCVLQTKSSASFVLGQYFYAFCSKPSQSLKRRPGGVYHNRCNLCPMSFSSSSISSISFLIKPSNELKKYIFVLKSFLWTDTRLCFGNIFFPAVPQIPFVWPFFSADLKQAYEPW